MTAYVINHRASVTERPQQELDGKAEKAPLPAADPLKLLEKGYSCARRSEYALVSSSVPLYIQYAHPKGSFSAVSNMELDNSATALVDTAPVDAAPVDTSRRDWVRKKSVEAKWKAPAHSKYSSNAALRSCAAVRTAVCTSASEAARGSDASTPASTPRFEKTPAFSEHASTSRLPVRAYAPAARSR